MLLVSITKIKTSNLSKAHETRGSSSCSHVVLVYLQQFRRNPPLKCALQRNSQKTLKPPILRVQSHSRSSKLIPLKMFVTNVCYDKQHVYAYLQLFSR